MYAKSPLYLQYLQSGYTFRFSLPKDVRSKFNRAEIKFSLRTHSFAKARSCSRLFALFMERMIADIRAGGKMSKLTDEQITKIVRDYFVGMIDTDEHVRSQGGWGEAHMLERYQELPQMKNELANCDHSRMIPYALYELKEQGIECDEEDQPNSRSC